MRLVSDDRPHTLDWHTKQQFISCTCGWQSPPRRSDEDSNDLYRQWWAHIGIDLEALALEKRDAALVTDAQDRGHTRIVTTERFISCTCGWQSRPSKNAKTLTRQWGAHTGIDLEAIKKKDAKRPVFDDIFTERGIPEDMAGPPRYTPWEKDNLDPVREAYGSLGDSSLNFALQIARQSRGYLIGRFPPKGLDLDPIYPEFRPKHAVKTKGRIWHVHVDTAPRTLSDDAVKLLTGVGGGPSYVREPAPLPWYVRTLSGRALENHVMHGYNPPWLLRTDSSKWNGLLRARLITRTHLTRI